MNGEYDMTAEQKAAMEQLQTLIPNANYEIAHRYLSMNHPDLFDNSGKSVAMVRMNWIPQEPASESTESAEPTNVQS